jgi:hypothetical protein
VKAFKLKFLLFLKILGPVGIVVGASAGILYSYVRFRGKFCNIFIVRLTLFLTGKFKSVAIIIKEDLTEDQRKRLCDHIVNAFKNIDAENLKKLVEFI